MLVFDYDNLVKNHIEIIKYAIEYGETFSVMTNLKKPYLKNPPIFEHDEVMKTFEPFIIDKMIGLRQWPGTIKASIDNHKVMITYKCCKQTLNLLIELPNIFLSVENKLPEDICFYKNEI